MAIQKKAKAKLPTPWADFSVIGFEDEEKGEEHLLIYLGDLGDESLLRIHSQCLTGDALFSLRCDCGPQLAMALERIASEGRGMVIYMAQEGRGIGLVNKIRAYELQDEGLNTVEANEKLGFAADERDYSYCKEMLSSVGVSSVRLMTNNPAKIKGLEDVGIQVSERIAIETLPTEENKSYLEVKSKQMGHMLKGSD
ncbi:GTP cyclohydrolase II [Gammaproteobacteria bacterium]|nr:GTP cyclohydrolase II [Gammaproteobacteria bacterium]MDC0508969.1 GTP cyclohydrolase II [Gammaproteobacteria bacterium]MDC0546012.1 GTP cyclohydrolase II [Gammaproteobacteria bacterium]MDC0569752.1 GTP cyclohydrolase II [Gammaproteobacteria bacterium]MDC0576815.1 GTP cyclohydrolase II [Gammaproteobacteria bacterium]|tara:strand:+ start:2587 stop:3177 length:591 start_codon:yes stop_codon:yes gene_type:complete